MNRKKNCVECRYCDLDSSRPGRPRYWCRRTGQVLPAALLARPACERWREPAAVEHWGP